MGVRVKLGLKTPNRLGNKVRKPWGGFLTHSDSSNDYNIDAKNVFHVFIKVKTTFCRVPHMENWRPKMARFRRETKKKQFKGA